MSIKPEVLDVVKRLNEVLSFGNSGLSRIQEEGIATVVSVANKCRYGAMTRAGFLRRHSKDLDMASNFLCDYTQASLSATSTTDRRIFDFVVQVTQEPSGMSEDDVGQLRYSGLDEPQILSVVLIACLSNFMDRLANSFGVDLEPRHRRALDNWLTGPAAQQDWLMPLPVKTPADSPKKAKKGLFDGKGSHDASSDGTPAPPEEPTDLERNDSLTQAEDFLSDLGGIIKSGVLTNGSSSADELEEEDFLDVPTFGEEDTYTGEETNSGSGLGSPSPDGMAYPGGQDDAPEDDEAEPTAGEGAYSEYPENIVESNPADQMGDVSESPSGQSFEAGPRGRPAAPQRPPPGLSAAPKVV